MRHTHAHHGDPAHANAPGILITKPRGYELISRTLFAGRRRHAFARLAGLSGARAGDRVLDVGCGTGALTRAVATAVSPGGRVLGIDPSGPVVAYARTHAAGGGAGTAFALGTAQDLPAPDGSYDAVVSSFVIHHLPEDVRARALAEMHRVLRPGGRLLLADFRPPHRNPRRNPRRRSGHRLIGASLGHAMADNPVDELRSLVDDAGFVQPDSGDLRPFLHYVRAAKPPVTLK